MKPDDPGNVQKLSEGNSASYRLTDPDTFVNGEVTVQLEEGELTAPYAALAMGTSVEMQGLKVVDIYTTTNEDSSSKGAMTLTCEADGVTISVRTIVMTDDAGNIITEDAYQGKTIDVKGIVDCFNGSYQIKVLDDNYINVH
jgi:DNA/RNA endonuclease YhcR with UshA esterase domain